MNVILTGQMEWTVGEFCYHFLVSLGNIQWSQCWPGNHKGERREAVSFLLFSQPQKNNSMVTISTLLARSLHAGMRSKKILSM